MIQHDNAGAVPAGRFGVSAETVLFLHIGRTGGTTLNSMILRQYPATRRFFVDSVDMPGSIATFVSLPMDQRARIRLLYGHFSYGLHELIPGPATYITMLRDPTDRVLSVYNYVKTRKDHRLHDQVRKLSLEEFLRSGITTEVDNGQVRSIANALHVPYGDLSPDALTLARRNMDSFAVVGLTEHFDETVLMLQRRFGWRRLAYAPRNALSRTALGHLNREQRKLVDAHTAMDQALYDDQRRRLLAIWHEPHFRRELRKYQRRNRLLRPGYFPAAWCHDLWSRRLHEN